MTRIARRIAKPDSPPDAPSPFTGLRHEAAAGELLAAMSATPGASVLLSVGESQYGGILSHAAPAIRSRLVVCCHQPPSWWRLHWRDTSVLDGLGAIVCLSREQQDYYHSLTQTPAILIRHGVSLDFFTPSNDPGDPAPRLLFVGHWLRDFETLAASMEHIWRSNPQVELDCVIPHHVRDIPALLRLARNPKVRWHAAISSTTLRNLYRRATLLFLPLVDSTANNAIVEALASGLPVVSSNVGGIADYVPEICGQLCPPGEANAHAEAVLVWLKDPGRLAHARVACRQYAMKELDWDRIAGDLLRSFASIPALAAR